MCQDEADPLVRNYSLLQVCHLPALDLKQHLTGMQPSNDFFHDLLMMSKGILKMFEELIRVLQLLVVKQRVPKLFQFIHLVSLEYFDKRIQVALGNLGKYLVDLFRDVIVDRGDRITALRHELLAHHRQFVLPLLLHLVLCFGLQFTELLLEAGPAAFAEACVGDGFGPGLFNWTLSCGFVLFEFGQRAFV
uniref:Uncharacterized protein n=1 Tax=Strombidium inclinatum TaxID=197538 RepID=A0A7S3MTT2_9SPIT